MRLFRTLKLIGHAAVFAGAAICLLVLVMLDGALALLADLTEWRWAQSAETIVRQWVLAFEESMGL